MMYCSEQGEEMKKHLTNLAKHSLDWAKNVPRNRNSMRRLALLAILTPLLWLTLLQGQVPASLGITASTPVKDAILAGFLEQTGARNAVAAVYLNYRLFDTLLETLLLAVSVTGIVYFLEEKGRETTDKST